MATDYKMSWRKEHGGRWRKRYKGKDYYISAGGESKAESYSRCYKIWKIKKAEIDLAAHEAELRAKLTNEQNYQRRIAALIERNRSIEQSDKNSYKSHQEWLDNLGQIRILKSNLQYGLPFQDGPYETLTHPLEDVPPWKYETLAGTVKCGTHETLSANIKRFLERKRRQAERGELSPSRFESLNETLLQFQSLFVDDAPITALNSRMLTDYRDDLEKKIENKQLASYSARDALANAKQFARWAYKQELIDLPRSINSVDLSIPVAPKDIEVFTYAEIEAMLAEPTPERTQLYLMMMLNTGCQQKDIAMLSPGEVDWTNGRIKRKRSKTKRYKSVPVVDYLLWPETFELLKKYGSAEGDFALTNANGKPLLTEKLVDGKRKKIDNIKSAYDRLQNRLCNPKKNRDGTVIAPTLPTRKPPKQLRKTSATILETKYPHFGDLFLGHAAATMKDKHYAKYDQAGFDEAIAWLGDQLPFRKTK